MKIVLIAVGVVVLLAVAVEIGGKIAYRRWRKRFDAMPPDK